MFKKSIVYALICLPLVLSGCTTNSKDSDVGLKTHQNENPPADLKNLKSLAEQGDAEVQYNLGVMYDNGQGVPQDYKQAVYWYTKSAKQRDAKAQNNLGAMYYNGQGVPQDYKQAVYWYKKSAKQGNAKAQSDLGVMYYNGQGVPQDYKQAAYWLTKSAEQGNAGGQNNLGFMYANGRGVPKDFVIAYVWFNMGALNGSENAVKGRDIALQRMTSNQVATAKEISKKCYNSNYKDCTP